MRVKAYPWAARRNRLIHGAINLKGLQQPEQEK
jgi:hypothetical protein